MKVSKTLHEIYSELDRLRKDRDLKARLATSCMAEGSPSSAEHFVERFKWYDERIHYLSHITVEFEDKYETGLDEDD